MSTQQKWDGQDIVDVIFSVLFFVLLVVLIVQTIRFFKWKRRKSLVNKASTHFCMILTVTSGILATTSELSWSLMPSVHLTLNSLCYIPEVMGWYFLFTAYELALYNWIRAYNSIHSKSLLPFIVMLTTLNVLTFCLLCVAGTFYCISASQSAAANGYLTRQGNIMYLATLCLNAVVLSLGFVIYGAKIAWNLKSANSMKYDVSAKRDYYIFKITWQTLVISVTSFLGCVVGISTYASQDYTATSIAKGLFKIVMCSEVMYVARPRKTKPPTTLMHTDSDLSRRLDSLPRVASTSTASSASSI